MNPFDPKSSVGTASNPFRKQSGQRTLADIATIIIMVVTVVGVLIGIGLIVSTSTDPDTYDTIHPYAWDGLILIGVSLVQTVFALLFVRTCAAVGQIRDQIVR